MKLAIFKSIEHVYQTIDDEDFESINGYIRISEFVDVEFPLLPTGDLIAKEVSLLRDEKKKIQAETEIKLNNVDRKIGELLALPQPTQGE